MTMDACGPSAPDARTARTSAAPGGTAPRPTSRAVTTEADESTAPYSPHIQPHLGVPHRESHVR
ncbi:hypothetical protein [Streptomyces sp. SLBN-31]|uniref:hypothetical protein n=1 Tax=Streptomyces sp. SLBN-31 TaxID=2768444 RepID=UPI001151300B|nr:hypothetical protein [Streptomyces sp. SLBN-31]